MENLIAQQARKGHFEVSWLAIDGTASPVLYGQGFNQENNPIGYGDCWRFDNQYRFWREGDTPSRLIQTSGIPHAFPWPDTRPRNPTHPLQVIWDYLTGQINQEAFIRRLEGRGRRQRETRQIQNTRWRVRARSANQLHKQRVKTRARLLNLVAGKGGYFTQEAQPYRVRKLGRRHIELSGGPENIPLCYMSFRKLSAFLKGRTHDAQKTISAILETRSEDQAEHRKDTPGNRETI